MLDYQFLQSCWSVTQVLAAFVDSLEDKDDVDMVGRHREWEQLVRAERAALALAQTENRGGAAETSHAVSLRKLNLLRDLDILCLQWSCM